MKNVDNNCDSDRSRKRLRLDRQAKMSHKEKEAVRGRQVNKFINNISEYEV
jgi:hypothetical protein